MLSLRGERMWDGMLKTHVDGLMGAAVFHEFTQPDHGDPHDHPFGFRSIILFGGYVEQSFLLDGTEFWTERKPGDSFMVPAGHIHRIMELPEGRCETLILPGPHERKSGFYQFRDGQTFHRFWDESEFKQIAA